MIAVARSIPGFLSVFEPTDHCSLSLGSSRLYGLFPDDRLGVMVLNNICMASVPPLLSASSCFQPTCCDKPSIVVCAGLQSPGEC